jgi:hypothetical protein
MYGQGVGKCGYKTKTLNTKWGKTVHCWYDALARIKKNNAKCRKILDHATLNWDFNA